MNFNGSLAVGRLGESQIAQWLAKRGNAILPVYDVEIDRGKGPQVFLWKRELVAPDLLIFPDSEFVEAKHKSVFTWYRKTGCWQTGLDAHHWADYCEVQEQTGRRVWIAFLHRKSTPDEKDLRYGCPPTCPTGLFINSVSYLNGKVDHVDWGEANGSRHGMVYWNYSDLKKYAELDEVVCLAQHPED